MLGNRLNAFADTKQQNLINGIAYKDFFDLIPKKSKNKKKYNYGSSGDRIAGFHLKTRIDAHIIFCFQCSGDRIAGFHLKTAYPGLLTGTGYTHPTKVYFQFTDKTKQKLKTQNVSNTIIGRLASEFNAKEYVTKKDFIYDLNKINNLNDWPDPETVWKSLEQIKDDSAFQMGFFFDWTTGAPVITGSTVKGVLREPFPLRDKDEEKKDKEIKKGKTEYITDKLKEIMKRDDLPEEFITKLEKNIFEEKGDVFYDAYILPDNKGKIFADDYITPHKDEFSDPTPLRFLKIAPGVTFKFQFKLKNSNINGMIVTPEHKKKLFKRILLDFGIGAKRNTGYGVLV